MTRRRIYLTEEEWQWFWEYVHQDCSNASQAARIVYGGTPISVRVKGHKKKVKLKPLIDKIYKIWGQFLVRKPDGQLSMGKDTDQIEREQDAYLKRLRRRIPKSYT
jgi:hypothetical protein